MICEFEYLGLQCPIISIFSSKIFKDLFDLLFSRAYLLKNFFQYSVWRRFLFRWCIIENFNLKVLNFLVLRTNLIYRFLLYIAKAEAEFFI